MTNMGGLTWVLGLVLIVLVVVYFSTFPMRKEGAPVRPGGFVPDVTFKASGGAGSSKFNIDGKDVDLSASSKVDGNFHVETVDGANVVFKDGKPIGKLPENVQVIGLRKTPETGGGTGKGKDGDDGAADGKNDTVDDKIKGPPDAEAKLKEKMSADEAAEFEAAKKEALDAGVGDPKFQKEMRDVLKDKNLTQQKKTEKLTDMVDKKLSKSGDTPWYKRSSTYIIGILAVAGLAGVLGPALDKYLKKKNYVGELTKAVRKDADIVNISHSPGIDINKSDTIIIEDSQDKIKPENLNGSYKPTSVDGPSDQSIKVSKDIGKDGCTTGKCGVVKLDPDFWGTLMDVVADIVNAAVDAGSDIFKNFFKNIADLLNMPWWSIPICIGVCCLLSCVASGVLIYVKTKN